MADDLRDGDEASHEGHGHRLSTTDATFLEMERPTLHMHIGGLFVFDAPPDAEADARSRAPRGSRGSSNWSDRGCTWSRGTARSWSTRRSG